VVVAVAVVVMVLVDRAEEDTGRYEQSQEEISMPDAIASLRSKM
jgi:hypothetical protein